MALKKQSIRQGVYVLIDGVNASKEELITLSETWTEKKEVFFRKMLQQGGKIKVQGDLFEIRRTEHKIRNSRGVYEPPTILKKPEDWEE